MRFQRVRRHARAVSPNVAQQRFPIDGGVAAAQIVQQVGFLFRQFDFGVLERQRFGGGTELPFSQIKRRAVALFELGGGGDQSRQKHGQAKRLLKHLRAVAGERFARQIKQRRFPADSRQQRPLFRRRFVDDDRRKPFGVQMFRNIREIARFDDLARDIQNADFPRQSLPRFFRRRTNQNLPHRNLRPLS